ncbi:hypothetical protein M569_04892 [Genlisea aurea]|uniref:Uncharacterized protein n=1 Tax=Genlisea aurea TaxID=192259 RepID=S8CY02_9LAMI|nr:hypothetical protein M569_04892 [Genlisea aurea]
MDPPEENSMKFNSPSRSQGKRANQSDDSLADEDLPDEYKKMKLRRLISGCLIRIIFFVERNFFLRKTSLSAGLSGNFGNEDLCKIGDSVAKSKSGRAPRPASAELESVRGPRCWKYCWERVAMDWKFAMRAEIGRYDGRNASTRRREKD